MTELRKKAYLTDLRPINQLLGIKFYTFDVETKDGLIGDNIFCWSLAYFKRGYHEQLSILTGKNADFKSLLDLFGSKKHKTHWSIVYAHNMEFDVRHIINYCVVHDISYNEIRSGSNMISVEIECFKVKFIDSVQFLKEGQEKAEFSWNVNPELRKIDCSDLWNKNFKNWSNSDKKRLIEHNKNDVLALHEIIRKLRNTIFEISKVDLLSVISISQLTLKAFRINMGTNPLIPEYKTNLFDKRKALINPFLYTKKNIKGKGSKKQKHPFSYTIRHLEYDFVRLAYFGGKCELYNLNPLENMAYFDRNSMFPAEMYNNDYPIGMPYFSKDRSRIWRIIKKTHKNTKLAIIRAKITPRKDNNFPLLPIRSGQKVMFTNQTRIWNYTSVELYEAWKDGAKIEPLKALIYPAKAKIFRNYIGKMYEFRKKFSKEIDSGKNMMAKYFMNTLYGKFAQRMVQRQMQYKFFNNLIKSTDFVTKKEKELKDKRSKLEKKFDMVPYVGIKERPITIGKYRVEWMEKRESGKPFMITHLSVFTTAYARINLWKLQMKLQNEGITTKYCDTDSLVIPIKYKDKMPLGKELGDWKIEAEFKRVKFLAPKAYIAELMDGKLFSKLKGLDRNALKKIMKNVKSFEELEKEVRKRIEIDERYCKFSQSCHYGEVIYSKTSTKKFSFENLKRNFDKNTGLSEPYNDETIPEEFIIPEKPL